MRVWGQCCKHSPVFEKNWTQHVWGTKGEEKLTCDPGAVCRESMAIVAALTVCSGLEWLRTGHLTFWICCCFHIIVSPHMLVDKKWYLVLTYVCLLVNAVTHHFISSPCIFTSLWIVHVLASFFSWGFFVCLFCFLFVCFFPYCKILCKLRELTISNM